MPPSPNVCLAFTWFLKHMCLQRAYLLLPEKKINIFFLSHSRMKNKKIVKNMKWKAEFHQVSFYILSLCECECVKFLILQDS